MKKVLLSCLLGLGVCASAQVIVHESFENGTTWTNFTTTGLTQYNLSGTETCNTGTKALGRQFTSATTAVLLYTSTASASNGKAINISAKYHQWGNTAYPVGNIKLEYAVGASTTYTALSTFTFSGSEEYSCSTISGVIPEGTVPAGTSVKVRLTTTNTVASAGYTALYDEVNIVQEVTAVPACTTFSAPANAATGVSVRPTLTWGVSAGAEYYKLKIGTTSGASNAYSATLSTNTYTPTAMGVLAPNTKYYASVTPTNALGDATGCNSEISFTTGANPFAPYCGPIIASTTTYPLSSVTMNGVTNTSAATTGSPAHEDFTSKVFSVEKGGVYPLNMTATGAAGNRFGFTVFVDWNQDGDFNDANESYFTTAPFLGASVATNTVVGNITVPAGASVGNTRMRIKYNFNASTTALITALSNPCEDVGNGQVEDYTILVSEATTAPNCTTVSSPAAGATIPSGTTTLTWAAAGGATGYKLTVGTTSGGSDVFNATVSATSQSVTLNAATTYYVKVVPTNNVGDATGCVETSFMTCGKISTFPATESFDTTTLAACWTNTATSGTNVWTYVTANGNNTITPHSGARMAEFRNTNPGSKAELIMPTMDISALGNPSLKFYYANVNWEGDIDELRVYYKDSTAGTWTILGTYTTENTAWKEIILPLPNKSSNYTIKFEGTSNYARGINLDDVTVFHDVTMAVNDINKANVSVYPNPFKNVLKISDIKDVKSINVSDASGRIVKSPKVSQELDLSSLSKGVYFVTVSYENGTSKTFKAIKD